MFEHMCLTIRRAGMIAATVGLMFCSVAAQAKPADTTEAAIVGRIDFDAAKLPPANVELDLKPRHVRKPIRHWRCRGCRHSGIFDEVHEKRPG